MGKKTVRFIINFLLFFLLVTLDQITKREAADVLMGSGPYVIWDGVFEFLYSENRGAAFGLLQNQRILFFAVAFLVFCVVLYLLCALPAERKYLPLLVCMTVIAAGAAGNMIDRVMRGYVIDFLYFKLIDFPIFNVADCYVTCATGFLFVLLFFGFYKEEEILSAIRSGRRGREQ